METYLTLLYVTLEQEIALKDFFASKGWMYFKPDLNVMTERVGPFEIPTAHKTTTNSLSSCNRSTYIKAIATSNVTQEATFESGVTSEVSPAFVVKDVDESRVKIEVSGIIDESNDVDDCYMDENIDDGDNDDDFADSMHLDVSVGNDSTIPGYVNDAIDKTDICAVSKSEHSNANFPDTNDVDVDSTSLMTRDRKNIEGGDSGSILKEDCDMKIGQNIDSSDCNNDLIISLPSAEQSSEAKTKKSRQRVRKSSQSAILMSKNSFQKHLITHSMQDSSFEEFGQNNGSDHVYTKCLTSCKYCGITYQSKRSLKEHILTKHEKGSAKWYQCNVCGIKKSRKNHLLDHLNTHYNTNPYSCKNCGRGYKNKSSYNRHIRDCGSGIKHGCVKCGRMYKTSASVIEHIKICHDQQNVFKCECGLEFKCRSTRWKHQGFCDQHQLHKKNIQVKNSDSIVNNTVEVTLSLDE